MDTIDKETTLYVFNENGMIPNDNLNNFSSDIQKESRYEIEVLSKLEIDINSTIFQKLYTDGLEFTIYDHGYVMKIEGQIVKVIFFLNELDKTIPREKQFFVSPVQAIQNNKNNEYPRGTNLQGSSLFLDELFNNKEYSNAIKQYCSEHER